MNTKQAWKRDLIFRYRDLRKEGRTYSQAVTELSEIHLVSEEAVARTLQKQETGLSAERYRESLRRSCLKRMEKKRRYKTENAQVEGFGTRADRNREIVRAYYAEKKEAVSEMEALMKVCNRLHPSKTNGAPLSVFTVRSIVRNKRYLQSEKIAV